MHFKSKFKTFENLKLDLLTSNEKSIETCTQHLPQTDGSELSSGHPWKDRHSAKIHVIHFHGETNGMLEFIQCKQTDIYVAENNEYT